MRMVFPGSNTALLIGEMAPMWFRAGKGTINRPLAVLAHGTLTA